MALETRKELIEVSINYDNGHVSVMTREILFDTDSNEKVQDLELNKTGYMPSQHRKQTLLEVLNDRPDIKKTIDELWTVDYMNKMQPKEV